MTNASSPRLKNLLRGFIANMEGLMISQIDSQLISFSCKLSNGAIALKIEHIKKGLGFWKFSQRSHIPSVGCGNAPLTLGSLDPILQNLNDSQLCQSAFEDTVGLY